MIQYNSRVCNKISAMGHCGIGISGSRDEVATSGSSSGSKSVQDQQESDRYSNMTIKFKSEWDPHNPDQFSQDVTDWIRGPIIIQIKRRDSNLYSLTV